jgi:CheY-like chemotaxis protein
VDDEAIIRLVMGEMLSDLGWTVLEASNAASALQVLASGRHIGLLVSDLGLLGAMSGQELITATRTMQPNLPVLIVTGDERKLTAELDARMWLILKPFRQRDLVQALIALQESTNGPRFNSAAA